MNEFLGNILYGINSVVNNYGWSIVVFTILIKLILFPLDYKSRKSMRRMQSIQPEVTKLQKKYANDKEKLNQKTSELYRREKINPLSGCLPLLISFPVLLWMFGAMRLIANTELAKQAIDLITGGTQNNETWFWVKNLWMPDSPFSAIIPDAQSLKLIPADIWQKVFAGLDAGKAGFLANLGEYSITAQNISGETIFTALTQSAAYASEMQLWQTMPTLNLILFKLNIFANPNGFFILPLLAGVTQYLMTIFQPQTAPAEGQPNTGAFMKWFFPLFSLYICSSYNAGFSLYWVISNLIAAVQGVVLNKVFDAKDKKDAQAAMGEGSIK